jgi:hypothetical protein
MRDERRIQAYLARELSEPEADRFEEELLADDDLAHEVQRALEIRAALGNTAATQAPVRARRNPRLMYALAAAAGIAFIALAIPWLQRPSEAPVFRGVEQRMGLEIEVDGDELQARWAPVAGAIGYELRILARDGRVLESIEVEAAEAAVDVGGERAPGLEPAFAEVVALDDLGQTVRRSDRIAITD